MIHDIPKPEVSPDFTIDDIHRIREYHYELLKDATPEERTEYYTSASQRVEQQIEQRRRALATVAAQ